ncbi:hypothetical protein HDU83_003692 [Entophlyctis luteolus]|nr:hypothetical protein HDU82_005374 [Entophlyctis luteolus]KAJ3345842.1 hypothetical protein HDU83_003692 [Entophlyctis luteolus]KAJ3377852.1 hypothetical protein HDU84_008137 [Entophlyctis sp. JEL0112]
MDNTAHKTNAESTIRNAISRTQQLLPGQTSQAARDGFMAPVVVMEACLRARMNRSAFLSLGDQVARTVLAVFERTPALAAQGLLTREAGVRMREAYVQLGDFLESTYSTATMREAARFTLDEQVKDFFQRDELLRVLRSLSGMFMNATSLYGVLPRKIVGLNDRETDAKFMEQLLNQAISGGSVDAMNWLGILYKDGEGIPIDHEKAIQLFRMAASKGHIGALNNLGTLSTTLGDFETAVRSFRESAEHNDATGCHSLGWLYDRGFGVVQDHATALIWFEKARSLGHESASASILRTRSMMGDQKSQLAMGIECEKLYRAGVHKKIDTTWGWYEKASQGASQSIAQEAIDALMRLSIEVFGKSYAPAIGTVNTAPESTSTTSLLSQTDVETLVQNINNRVLTAGGVTEEILLDAYDAAVVHDSRQLFDLWLSLKFPDDPHSVSASVTAVKFFIYELDDMQMANDYLDNGMQRLLESPEVEDSMKTSIQMYGLTDPRSWPSIEGLGEELNRSRQYKKAEICFLFLLMRTCMANGITDADTLKYVRRLGKFYVSRGDFAEAAEYYLVDAGVSQSENLRFGVKRLTDFLMEAALAHDESKSANLVERQAVLTTSFLSGTCFEKVDAWTERMKRQR